MKAFVRWAAGTPAPAGRLLVSGQSFPGTAAVEPDEGARRGIPDGCITNGTDWALLIESKLAQRWRPDQLRRHLATASRYGLHDARLLCLLTGPSPQPKVDRCVVLHWPQVHAWLLAHERQSEWARRCARYFEVAEARLIERGTLGEGSITMFNGIPFGGDEPYSYDQAKRLLSLLRRHLLEDTAWHQALGIDPVNPGRGAITGARTRMVWDFIGLKVVRRGSAHTGAPHLTIGILDDRLEAMLTLPNGMKREHQLAALGTTAPVFSERVDAFLKAVAVLGNRVAGAVPVVTVLQRHYASQRAHPVSDAELRFDPRTAFAQSAVGGVKWQPQWLPLAYEVATSSRANVQFQIGVEFPYAKCPMVNSADIAGAMVDAWRACAPFLAPLGKR